MLKPGATLLLITAITLVSKAQLLMNKECIALQHTFTALQKDNSKENQQAFLEAFPYTAYKFVATYAYTDSTKSDCPLYDSAYSHIMNGLAKLDKIPKVDLYRRYIHLSQAMKWDADAVNYFQSLLTENIAADTDDFISTLESFELQSQINFWTFYFDQPVPYKEIPKELKSLEKSNKANSYWLILDAFLAAKPYR